MRSCYALFFFLFAQVCGESVGSTVLSEADWKTQCANFRENAVNIKKSQPPRNVTIQDIQRGKTIGWTHAIFDEDRKIIMCPIQKVASSEWKKFFHRMIGIKNYHQETYHFDQTPTISTLLKKKYSIQEMTKKLNDAIYDPEWTSTIFFRDPLRRLLSVFLMLFGPDTAPSPRPGVPLHKVQLGRYRREFGIHDDFTYLQFDDFVEQVTREKDPITNIHWKPQSLFCLSGDFINSFNFIGNFEHLSTDAELFFRCTGTYEKYARSGWGHSGKAQLFGHSSNSAPHQTKSQDLYDKMVTPEIQEKVWRHFAKDYDMFRRVRASPFNLSYVLFPSADFEDSTS